MDQILRMRTEILAINANTECQSISLGIRPMGMGPLPFRPCALMIIYVLHILISYNGHQNMTNL